MNSSGKNYFKKQTRPYQQTFLRQKQFAFLTTAAALFCAFCFLSSLYLKDCETTSHVDISASTENPERIFEKAIGKEIADEKLMDHLTTAIEQTTPDTSVDVERIDLERVRESLNFRIAPNKTGQQYRLTAAYVGNGSRPEKALTQSIVHAVAHRLGGVDNTANAMDAFNEKCEFVQANIESNAQNLHDELSEANDLVNYLNSDLSDVHAAVESIRPEERFGNPETVAQDTFDRGKVFSLLDSLQQKLDELSVSSQEERQQIARSIASINDRLKEFNIDTGSETNQSIRIINAALPESNTAIKSILEMLENVDTDSIQTRIGQIQNHLKVDTVQIREGVSELRAMTSGIQESRFVVNAMSKPRTRPVDSALPNIGHVFLFGLVALIGGAITATYYLPELENLGFESENEVSTHLGLPIVSSLISDRQVSGRRETWSNSVVRICEVGLFGFILLVAILCFIQPEIGQAFYESPFYGLSKIADLFF